MKDNQAVEMRTRPDGHLEMKVDGQWYLSSHVAWMYVHGRWPTHGIEHINGDKTDLRLANLRECKP